MATPEEIIAVICPDMLTTAGYQTYIDLAVLRTSQEFFADKYELAVALRASHIWFLTTKNRGQPGAVTYKMEGRLAVSYGGIGVTKRELELSTYGLQLLDLIKTMRATVTTTSAWAATQQRIS